jgi:hypothetical protein
LLLLQVEWFTTYLAAQEEEGYVGTFADFLQQKVSAEKQITHKYNI